MVKKWKFCDFRPHEDNQIFHYLRLISNYSEWRIFSSNFKFQKCPIQFNLKFLWLLQKFNLLVLSVDFVDGTRLIWQRINDFTRMSERMMLDVWFEHSENVQKSILRNSEGSFEYEEKLNFPTIRNWVLVNF